jgi:hypothetical protein
LLDASREVRFRRDGLRVCAPPRPGPEAPPACLVTAWRARLVGVRAERPSPEARLAVREALARARAAAPSPALSAWLDLIDEVLALADTVAARLERGEP